MQFERKRNFYELHTKRLLDVVCALFVIIIFWWLYLIVALIVRVKMGSPVIFKQPRPGIIDQKTGKEKIFKIYKFRTMSDEKDEDGNLLPDEKRLVPFGRMLRRTSLDELPEVLNILKGDMSVIGPRPQLVRDLVFMTDEQRLRHTAKPGLNGLAQVNGRNAITWEEKFCWDLKYVENVTLIEDLKIVWLTIKNVLLNIFADVNQKETDVTLDLGDALLAEGKVTRSEYCQKQALAEKMLSGDTK